MFDAPRLVALRQQIDDALATLVHDREPAVLYAPAHYVLTGGGKRVRPLLVLLAAEATGGAVEDAWEAALAVEVFHNFTLVHDDIMDDAPERRGRATVHEAWDEGTAILVGDRLMGLSYELLTQGPAEAVSKSLTRYHTMVSELCRGQALDADFETQREVSVAAYLDMIDGKTGALLGACLAIGGLMGGAEEPTVESLHRAGKALGRAFQIQDDLLDVVAQDDAWGKAVGGDLRVGKRTYITLTALERAEGDDRAWFMRGLDGGFAPERIPEARARMEALDVFTAAREAVHRYSEAALRHLSALPDGPAATHLRGLVNQLRERTH
ncbi:polyprenyl synthetase family protein [Salisaeta longa]|uniref:polyprenyl synthetase family protein n=1 Tax=Salisaeta longa TaxID=503170 RepID=UPI0003B2E9A9|nr:polyprenyl synthetase family protein [Salisaeta longa]